MEETYYEVVAQVRMIVPGINPESAEDAATVMLNDVAVDIEHIEVTS